MNKDTFELIFEKQIDICREMLITKAGEYASDDDRLHNFDVTAVLKGETPQEALSGFMAKHTVSIYDMCRAPDGKYTMEQWNEKITDHINYLIILKAIVHESTFEAKHSGQMTITGATFRLNNNEEVHI